MVRGGGQKRAEGRETNEGAERRVVRAQRGGIAKAECGRQLGAARTRTKAKSTESEETEGNGMGEVCATRPDQALQDHVGTDEKEKKNAQGTRRLRNLPRFREKTEGLEWARKRVKRKKK